MKTLKHYYTLFLILFISTATFSQSPANKLAANPNFIPITYRNLQYNEKDVTYLQFEKDATDGFDNQYDEYKISMPASGISSSQVLICSEMDNKIPLSIDARPIPSKSDTIALNIGGYNGSYTLDFSNTKNLKSNYHLALIDKYFKTIINLDKDPIYNFNVLTNDSSTLGRRFDVIVSTGVIAITTSIDFSSPVFNSSTPEQYFIIYPNPVTSGHFTIRDGVGNGDKEVIIFNASGEKVFEKKYFESEEINVEINEGLIPGIYVVEIKNERIEKKHKLIIE
jgi:hypothetical protein